MKSYNEHSILSDENKLFLELSLSTIWLDSLSCGLIVQLNWSHLFVGTLQCWLVIGLE